jgi:hypothetical protein
MSIGHNGTMVSFHHPLQKGVDAAGAIPADHLLSVADLWKEHLPLILPALVPSVTLCIFLLVSSFFFLKKRNDRTGMK